ncbi:MAG: cupin domain-containing protein [Bacteroidales bacterium]|nr:cupin domain-containing protein [Bacteroidales bacterium]
MKITDLSNANKVPFDLDGKIMFSDKNLEIIHLHLKPGELLAKHNNPFDVIFYVLAGQGILKIENEKKIIRANSCIEVKSGLQRSWENNSNDSLMILVIKVWSMLPT